jgi:L-alanine-DL-glutamate epimerase-like enolase superfamily enzyme
MTGARALGMGVFLGCMVESSLGIAAAAHLAPLADYVDLDGHLLLSDDPWTGLRFEDGRVLPDPERSGLGVEPIGQRIASS